MHVVVQRSMPPFLIFPKAYYSQNMYRMQNYCNFKIGTAASILCSGAIFTMATFHMNGTKVFNNH